MAHMKKRMTFHGVDYIVVPVELWEECKERVNEIGKVPFQELHTNMLAYEGSNEPEELNNG